MATGNLQEYNRKRDFGITPEPPGEVAAEEDQYLQFCIQKHDATRLHYDFRLELDGVLKSWAVTKGPSYDPKVKRLAMRTEDHPLSYGDFEGIIPEGQYGAGPVMLWDAGQWIPRGDPREGLTKGKLSFTLRGEKMQGDWALVRMKDTDEKGRKRKESWLLIKERDEYARGNGATEQFLEQEDYSVKSGRNLAEIAKRERPKGGTPAAATRKNSEKKIDDLRRTYGGVQLATLVDAPPQGDNWLHEVKYDGYRVLCFVVSGSARIYTRNGHDWTNRFGPVASALETLEVESAVLDGEAVILDEKGISSFHKIQNAFKGEGEPDFSLYLFDLLHLNGKDYKTAPQMERKERLEELLKNANTDRLKYSDHVLKKGDRVIEQACAMGLEGIISKRADAPYSASRTRNWLKSKCSKRQEFVICGYVPATDRKDAIGSLHLGYNSDHRLVYAGKVGTGFNHKTAADLYRKLSKHAVDKPPFDEKPAGRFPKTTWVSPELICEVQFGMWTEGGKIRHASFQGLREDKAAAEITREAPAALEEAAMSKTTARPPAGKARTRSRDFSIRGVKITHPDRVIFPDAGITKAELAEFYSDAADIIMPLIARRPLSLVRCPGGITSNCFFQRSKGKGMPEHIYRFDVEHKGKVHDYLYIEQPMGLVELVQMSTIEIHPWGAKNDKINYPDRMIFDLDPDPSVPFDAVKLAAQDIRNRLESRGLQSFLKVTGGKGLHVTVPLQPHHDWAAVKAFSGALSKQMVADVPEAYTATITKAKRKGKILVDYFRNDFAATAVMDFCVRSRPGAPVAVPLEWEELEDLRRPDQFSLGMARERLGKAKKLIDDFIKTRQALPQAR